MFNVQKFRLERSKKGKKGVQFVSLVLFLFWKTLGKIWRISAAKMKLLTIMIVITVVGLCGKACQEKQWRTHKTLCCNNGSAIQSATGKWVWVQQRPLICGPLQPGAVEKKCRH